MLMYSRPFTFVRDIGKLLFFLVLLFALPGCKELLLTHVITPTQPLAVNEMGAVDFQFTLEGGSQDQSLKNYIIIVQVPKDWIIVAGYLSTDEGETFQWLPQTAVPMGFVSQQTMQLVAFKETCGNCPGFNQGRLLFIPPVSQPVSSGSIGIETEAENIKVVYGHQNEDDFILVSPSEIVDNHFANVALPTEQPSVDLVSSGEVLNETGIINPVLLPGQPISTQVPVNRGIFPTRLSFTVPTQNNLKNHYGYRIFLGPTSTFDGTPLPIEKQTINSYPDKKQDVISLTAGAVVPDIAYYFDVPVQVEHKLFVNFENYSWSYVYAVPLVSQQTPPTTAQGSEANQVSFFSVATPIAQELWIRAIIETEKSDFLEAVWQLSGETTTARGDKVIWGYFYANPADVTWGNPENPEVFVKIWFDANGHIDVNYFYISGPPIHVYTAHTGTSEMLTEASTFRYPRYIRHYFHSDGTSNVAVSNHVTRSFDDDWLRDYGLFQKLTGYTVLNNLQIGALIQMKETRWLEGIWQLGGQGKTERGDEVAWGYFYADPSVVNWGNPNNPDVFVKIWFDRDNSRIHVNYFHTSVADIIVRSGFSTNDLEERQSFLTLVDRYNLHGFYH